MSTSESVYLIIELAIQVEDEGAKFYQKLAKLVQGQAAKDMFLSFVKDELRHKDDFANIAKSVPRDIKAINSPVNCAQIMSESVNELKKFIKGAEPVGIDSLYIKQVLDIGIHNEKGAIRIYSELRDILPRDFQGILDLIIKEENSHLEKILQHKSKLLS